MKTWNYLSNTFLIVTEESYRKCRKIGDYTLSALHANMSVIFFNTLYTGLKPFVDSYKTAYDAWLAQQGTQKSKTNTLTVKLKTLQSELIERWDIQIQGIYPQRTSEYITLLPHRRTPFQSGSQEDRIAALSALSTNLIGIASLSATKAEVDSALLDITLSLDDQKAHISMTKVDSSAVDAARVALCIELYGVLGLLMHHFRESPTEVDNFFDTETIRNHMQTIFKKNIAGGETLLAMTHTFIDGEEIRLVNRGYTPLRFALCAEANDSIGSIYVELPANEEVIVPIESLGNLAHRYLKVQNLNPTEGGKYTIMLL